MLLFRTVARNCAILRTRFLLLPCTASLTGTFSRHSRDCLTCQKLLSAESMPHAVVVPAVQAEARARRGPGKPVNLFVHQDIEPRLDTGMDDDKIDCFKGPRG